MKEKIQSLIKYATENQTLVLAYSILLIGLLMIILIAFKLPMAKPMNCEIGG